MIDALAPRRPMAAIPARVAAIATTAILALGCSSSSPDANADSAATSRAASGRAVTPVVAPAPWYRHARALDLTGDGRPDSVRLEAYGARPDSLGIVLTLVVDGEERHREEWGSSYELALLDPAVRAGPQAAGILRARLDTVAASVVVARLDSPSVQLMAEDRPALDSLQSLPTELVSFSYGYESTTRLVWDGPRERFVRLWSCC